MPWLHMDIFSPRNTNKKVFVDLELFVGSQDLAEDLVGVYHPILSPQQGHRRVGGVHSIQRLGWCRL